VAATSPEQGTSELTEVLGIQTRYRQAGTGADVLVLHGWGAQIESVGPIITGLATVARVTAVDLPGFGETSLPPEPWGVGDYANWVLALMDHLGISSAGIIGHSNGGRIAIHIGANHPERVTRLLLTDAAGIRPKRTAKYYAKVYSAKTVKHLAPHLGPLGRRMQQRIAARLASSDYASAGPLRPTFVKVVNEDLTPLLPQIKAPTLLIWGEHDDSTPVSDGQKMEQLIDDAALIVFEGAGHYAYLDDQARFNAIAANFFAAQSGPQAT
jgi:pimeloyl-ACP methyl ester carboxylesterase